MDNPQCPLLSSLYPVSIQEFPDLQLCDQSCTDYCTGKTSADCADCASDLLNENCSCPEGSYPILLRGITVDCSPCDAASCDACTEEGVCTTCKDPETEMKDGKYCECDTTTHAFDYYGECKFVCNQDCESCDPSDADKCTSCNDPNATPNGSGICTCNSYYETSNSAGEPLKCSSCNNYLACYGDCTECNLDSPNYCIACKGENTVAKDGLCRCVANHYPYQYTDEDQNTYTSCRSKQ